MSILETHAVIAFEGFAILFVAAAIAGNTFALLHLPIVKEFGWGRARTSWGQAILLLATVFGLCFVDRALHQFGIQHVILCGILVMVISLTILSRVSRLGGFWLAMALMGLASALATVVPVQAFILGWIPDGAGKIMGWVFAGQHLGGVAMPPVVHSVLKRTGWRRCSLMLGLPLLVLLVLVLFLRNPPQLPAVSEYWGSWVGLSSSKTSWRLGLVILLAGLGTGGLAPHMIGLAEKSGFGITEGARALSTLHGGTIVGTLVVGWAADKLDKGLLIGLVYFLGLVGIVVLLISSRSATSLYLSAGLIGIPDAAFPAWTLLIREHYGLSNAARLLGIAGAVFLFGRSPSAVFPGYSYDLWKSYRPGLLLAAALLLAASVLIAL